MAVTEKKSKQKKYEIFAQMVGNLLVPPARHIVLPPFTYVLILPPACRGNNTSMCIPGTIVGPCWYVDIDVPSASNEGHVYVRLRGQNYVSCWWWPEAKKYISYCLFLDLVPFLFGCTLPVTVICFRYGLDVQYV